VLDPVFDREELLICDLDLNQIDREMMTFDVSGHYSRPDLFRFETKVSVPGEKLKTE
jgi:nitrilase